MTRRALVSHQLREFRSGNSELDQYVNEYFREFVSNNFEDNSYLVSHSPGDHEVSAAEITAGVGPSDTSFPVGDPRRFGASPAQTAAFNRQAIQAALDSSSRVFIREPYVVDEALELRSNQLVEFDGKGSITLADGVTTEVVITGTSLANVTLRNAQIFGNGTAGVSNILLISCSNVLIDRCYSTMAGAQGIQLEGCDAVTVFACELSENYFFGIFDRDGLRNRYIGNRCFGNGDTGVADSGGGGRGINLWRCVDCYVAGNSFVGNTEYGFRLYSEAADASINRGHRVIGNYFEDNVRCDLVLYDESENGELVRECVLSGNIIRRTTVPTLDCAVLVHGGDNIISDTHVIAEGDFGDYTAYLLYFAMRTTIVNCAATNLRDCFRFSGADSEGVVIDNFRGYVVGTGCGPSGVVGQGHTIRNSRFFHGGGGSTDMCIANFNSSGRNCIEGNLIDGFQYGIYIGEEAVSIRDNITLNSTSSGLRKDGDAQVGQEIIGNVWDSTNPALIINLERRTAGNAVLDSNAAPTIRTWAVGDRCYNNAPSAGNPKSWVCTTAGTPGTWTSEGNL